MGSPVSPIVADIYMEDFEETALSTAPNPPSLWLRYVDDTFVLLHVYNIDSFTSHINSIDPKIQFTTEPETDGKLPFLDLCIHINDDGSTRITVYRKPTHTDQYLNFASNHPVIHKQSVVRTLMNRANNYITTEADRRQEVAHVKQALRANDYTEWSLIPPRPRQRPTTSAGQSNTSRPTVGLPYLRGMSEELCRVFRSHGVQTYLKPINTLRDQLVHPKDPTPTQSKSCVVYKLTCEEDSSHTYIGETKRTLTTRVKEHQKICSAVPTAIGEHIAATGHTISLASAQVLCREEHKTSRKVKEAVFIKQQKPTINRDTGVYLPPVYDAILLPGRRSTVTSLSDQGH